MIIVLICSVYCQLYRQPQSALANKSNNNRGAEEGIHEEKRADNVV